VTVALHSRLFRGDPKLEACLIHDSAHVTHGATGEHVAKIQVALATLDDLSIAPRDLSTETYGTSTAHAVLAYKTKRQIINRSYQTRPDDIVGKMTIAALDKEMFAHEHRPSPCEKCLMSRQGGEIEPAGLTTGAGHPSLNFALSAIHVVPLQVAQPLTPSGLALTSVPLALFWTNLGAISEIEALQALRFVSDVEKNSTLAFPSVFDAINTHFHLDRDPTHLRRNLKRLHDVYGLIRTVLNQASTFFRSGPNQPNSIFADAPVGGFQFGPPANRITFRQGYLNCGPNCRAAMIVHECAHLVGGLRVIDHFATEFPIPQGAPQGLGARAGRNYQQLHTNEALRNAASYAAYAIHAATGTDSRFGANNISV
jgi:hypothetical protein